MVDDDDDDILLQGSKKWLTKVNGEWYLGGKKEKGNEDLTSKSNIVDETKSHRPRWLGYDNDGRGSRYTPT